jgi:hypothetical protein
MLLQILQITAPVLEGVSKARPSGRNRRRLDPDLGRSDPGRTGAAALAKKPAPELEDFLLSCWE